MVNTDSQRAVLLRVQFIDQSELSQKIQAFARNFSNNICIIDQIVHQDGSGQTFYLSCPEAASSTIIKKITELEGMKNAASLT